MGSNGVCAFVEKQMKSLGRGRKKKKAINVDGHLFGVFVVGFFAGRRAKTRRMFFSLNFPLPPPPSKKRLWLVGVFFFFITWPVCFAAAWEQKNKKKNSGEG